MRAGRVLSILLLLQARGRMSATEIARELEVSVRTVYRDVEQLSSAGVPVYAERGRDGGFALIDGWQTRLTGLTLAEAQALFLSGLEGPVTELGLGAAAASAKRKVVASLSQAGHDDVQRMAARLHLDPVGWYAQEDEAAQLSIVAEALWKDRRIRMLYSSWTSTRERVVEPLGLVLKAGNWYLVARQGNDIRMFRVAEIRSAVDDGSGFDRPEAFDLATWWAAQTKAFETNIYTSTAVVLVTPAGRQLLERMNPTIRQAITATASTAEADGRFRLRIPIESVALAAASLFSLGAEIEVLTPRPLRSRLLDMARRMTDLYET